MKPLIYLFFIIALAVFISCNNDEEPYNKPESAMFFHGYLNAKEKTMIENQNGYRLKTEDTCKTLSNGISFDATSTLFQGNSNYYMSNRESLILTFHNMFDTVMTNSEQVITKYFTTPMPYFYIDTLIGTTGTYKYGVEVNWTDGMGYLYTSLNTPQNGTFTFENFKMEIGAFGRSIQFEAGFNCFLYCKEKQELIVLNDGTARFKVITNCY